MKKYFTDYFANETVRQNVNSIKSLARLMKMEKNLDDKFYDYFGLSLFVREWFLDFDKRVMHHYKLTEVQKNFFLKTHLFFWYHSHPDKAVRYDADELFKEHCKEYGFNYEEF